MSAPRSYRLLCPIARALDRLGDRWTLLILRDLHAGPARFTELQKGLPGIASNLLATRLEVLQSEGLIRKIDDHLDTHLYELTPLGQKTDEVLYTLGQFGALFPATSSHKKPGNLRLVAVTLKVACQRVAHLTQSTLRAILCIERENVGLLVNNGQVSVRYGRQPEPTDIIIKTSYDAMISVSDGRMSPADFASKHIEVTQGSPEDVGALLKFLGLAMTQMHSMKT